MGQDISKIYSLIKKSRACATSMEDGLINCGNVKLGAFCEMDAVLAMFHRLGFIKSAKKSKAIAGQARNVVYRIADGNNDSLKTVMATFLSYCRNGIGTRDAVCGKEPRCGVCEITGACFYWNKRPSIKELPEVERPRERLIHKGEDYLSDAELLGIIIRDGTPQSSAVEVARTILAKYGDFRALGAKTIAELCKVEGIGEAKASQIKAAIAIAKRYATIAVKPGAKMNSTNAIFNHFYERLRDKKQEIFYVVMLDVKNRMLTERVISTGGLNSSIVHPREVFSAAIREHAASVVFVHNHPSGDPEPSSEDEGVTQRLLEASGIVGIKIMDHIIIGGKGYVSFRERGLV